MSYLEFFATHGMMLLDLTGSHVVLSVVAVLVAVAVGVPVGAVVGHLHRFSFLAINGGNVLRAIPTLAVVAILLGLGSVGFGNILVGLVILALPLILTNTYAAVDTVEPGIVEAARGMGLRGWEILWRVELPNAVPLIMSGVRTAWVYVVATAYLAGFAGSTGTLGVVITNIASYGLPGVLAAATVSVVIAFLGEFLLGAAERSLTPTGIKLSRSAPAPA